MAEKLYLDNNDIRNMFGCGKNKAYEIIRSVKIVSDTLNLSGKITRKDLDNWLDRCGKRGGAEVSCGA